MKKRILILHTERRATGEKLMDEFQFKPPCSAKVVGFWNNSKAAELVLPPLLDCAIDEACWISAKNSSADEGTTDQVNKR